jgi:cytochrome c peroxidase
LKLSRILALPLVASLVTACTPSNFTAEELSRLKEHELGPLPPSPSNKYADAPAAAVLGQQLFFDPRFSGPLVVDSDLGRQGEAGKVACASCHDPGAGGSDHRSTPGNTSLAAGFTGRNANSVLNAGYYKWMFWDGRKDTVWSQALGPIESPVEHNFTRVQVVRVLFSHYKSSYEAIFGALPDMTDPRFPDAARPGQPAWDAMAEGDRDAINRAFANFGKAVEAYERKLVTRNSAFDRFLAGDDAALSPAAKRGAKLFVGKAACQECHSGPNFSDDDFHNLGVRQEGANIPAEDPGRFAGIAQVKGDEFNAAGAYADVKVTAHLDGLTATDADRGAFKTPTLRSVTKNAPYMHTGSLKSLREVVLFYRDGGHDSGFVGTRDEAMAELKLEDAEVDDLVAFLEALDGEPLSRELVSAPALP